MEPEIELELFAALCADVEAGRPLADVLRAEGLTEGTWARSRDAWMDRMSNGPEGERRTLEERYLVAFNARKRIGYAQTARPIDMDDDDGDEPPTNRAPMGTVIMPAPVPVAAAPEAPTKDTNPNDLPWGPASVTPPMGVTAPRSAESRAVAKEATPEVTPPMGVRLPNAVDVPWSKQKPNPEHTPPMGVAAPNRADIPPPKPLPKPEVTPPMGVAAPNLADAAPPSRRRAPEVTPPMGVAAPNLVDTVPASRRRVPEPTPPMRPRSDVVSDDLARSATDDLIVERKTDPPQPVPSRPALPFPPQMQGAGNGPMSTPAPSASAPFRSPTAGYPAVPPPQQAPQPAPQPTPYQQLPPPQPPPPPQAAPAQPQHFQQSPPQGSPGPTYGAYPSMVSLAAQVAGAGGAPMSSSSPGFAAPPKSVGAPLSIGAFQSNATGPRMTLEVYAAFAAEIAVKPVDVAEIRERYGLTDVQHTAEDEAWQRRFSSDRDTYVRYAKLFQHYRDWFSARKPR